MRSITGYISQLARPEPLVTNALRMLVGLLLTTTGFVISIPVFIGQYGEGISWWPILIPLGLALFLQGLLRCVGRIVRHMWQKGGLNDIKRMVRQAHHERGY